jgi:hypothetical protein
MLIANTNKEIATPLNDIRIPSLTPERCEAFGAQH